MNRTALGDRVAAMQRTLRDPDFRQHMRPFLALAALWVIFDLPSVLHVRGFSFKHFRLSGDVLAALTLGGASYLFGWGKWLRRALYVFSGLLVLYRIDEGVFSLLMHTKPLLYDQWFLMRHLFVLLSDLFSLQTLLVVGGGTVAVVLAIWTAMRLLRIAAPLVTPARIGEAGRVAYVTWIVVLLASALSSLTAMQRPLVRWVFPEVLDNIATSRKTFLSLKKNVGKSPYREFDKIVLKRKPDVKLLLIESYGRLLVRAKPTRQSYKLHMQAMQQRLTDAGWHMVSGYSRSSISGGRSWLAEGSLLMGTTVAHESVYKHLTSRIREVPTLPSFLGKQGYERMLVGPPDRARPGMTITNPYSFDTMLLYRELGYTGPAYGWGIVPDQYSMGILEERLKKRAPKPLFLDFHFVTSHAPWTPLPKYVEDFRTLNAVPGGKLKEKPGDDHAVSLLKRYARQDVPEYSYMGKLDGVLLSRYEQAVYYELQVIEEHLKKSTRDELVIVMGDHQPPVIASDKVSFDVPVHVMSRDKALLSGFKQVGFSPGLVLGPAKAEVMSHAGMLSLVVRALRVCCGEGPVPRFRSEGHEIVAPYRPKD
jgi:hypothetical protein